MPKESYLLKSFEGGLETHKDARDIENSSIPFSDGLSFSYSGKIKLLGDGFENVLSDILSEGLQQSNNLLTFQYDYDLGINTAEGNIDFDAEDSGTGYLGTPQFRENGVTYYVITSGDNSNEITIISEYIDDDGVKIYTTVPWNKMCQNSSPQTTSEIYSNDYYQSYTNQAQKLWVGPNSNANIVGYFVDGGFRYCDANFENKDNNIVGYFGHINKSYLTELNHVQIPGYDGSYTNQQFTRNHWHANTYENVYTGVILGDDSADSNVNNFKTIGMGNTLNGAWATSKDGFTQHNHIKSDNPQAYPNHKVWLYLAPNGDQFSQDTGDIHYTSWNEFESEYDPDTDSFWYKGSMEDGHELRRRWCFGISTCYDGDPQGICQETGVSYFKRDKNIGGVQTRMPFIWDLKKKHGTVSAETAWDALMDITPSGDTDSPATNFRYGNLDALPKLYFTWTFLPWWADHELMAAPTAFYTDDNSIVPRLSRKQPAYDGRITGFRIYMQEVDDPEQNWHNVATIDALRGVVSYEGCSTEEHPWIPRGAFESGSFTFGDDVIYDGGWQATRFEKGDAEENELMDVIPCWSNMTTGQNGIGSIHDGGNVYLEPHQAGYNDTDISGVTGCHPMYDSGCKRSVNIENIPDITYELLNGYKDNYSPTNTDWMTEDWHSGSYVSSDLEEYDFKQLTKSFGDVYRFKTATILNDRVYKGNLMSTKTGKIYPDRILKTEIGQYDIFVDDGYHHIDLATGDGDSIIHMETYFGKLFVWKRNTLYVIKVTDEGDEVIDATHKHYGVNNSHSIVLTKHGPVWFNDGGVYLHDMDGKIHNLITEKINRGKYIRNYIDWSDTTFNTWDNSGGDPVEDFILYNYLELPGLHDIMEERSNVDYMQDYILDYTKELLNWDTGIADNNIYYYNMYVNQIALGWKGFVGSDGSGGIPDAKIGYMAKDDKIIIVKSGTDSGLNEASGDAYIFDFYTKNWAYGRKLFPYGSGAFKSNFINDVQGNLAYFYNIDPAPWDSRMDEDAWVSPGGDVLPFSGLGKWNDASKTKQSIQFLTKDIDFESPGVRKNVHKIYITVGGAITPNVQVLYAVNGSRKFKLLNCFDGVQNYTKGSGFTPSSFEIDFTDNVGGNTQEDILNNWYTSILKPSSEGESLKNIYSIQLMFVGTNQIEAQGTSGADFNVDKNFQINDITFIYRAKNAN